MEFFFSRDTQIPRHSPFCSQLQWHRLNFASSFYCKYDSPKQLQLCVNVSHSPTLLSFQLADSEETIPLPVLSIQPQPWMQGMVYPPMVHEGCGWRGGRGRHSKLVFFVLLTLLVSLKETSRSNIWIEAASAVAYCSFSDLLRSPWLSRSVIQWKKENKDIGRGFVEDPQSWCWLSIRWLRQMKRFFFFFLKAKASDCVSPVCPERGWEINTLNQSRERFSVSHTAKVIRIES